VKENNLIDAEDCPDTSSQFRRVLDDETDSETQMHKDSRRGFELLRVKLSDNLDHPEIWEAWPQYLADFPGVEALVKEGIANLLPDNRMETPLRIANALCLAYRGKAAEAISSLEVFSTRRSTPLTEGAIFFLKGMADPTNPIYQLKGRVCKVPFQRFEVLEAGTYLCCPGWLSTPVGNCFAQPWEDVWNSPNAEAIRASMHDGSYRFCKKMTCPMIQSGTIPHAEALAAESDDWKEIVRTKKTKMDKGPANVSLVYDRSCNLRCPSCRTSGYMADSETRDRIEEMQEKNIIPMLRHAKMMFVTGSGDPFASRNFRSLMMRLGPEDYPDLRFLILTNGMLLTRKEWEKFPNLHGRIKRLRISIDAATKETHETLRLGAKWSVMLENMEFFGELKQKGLVEEFSLAFIVQQENYKEMGSACELAERLGAEIWFTRLANWGTFTKEEYLRKAVFLSSHPEYPQFLEAMQDPRLLGKHVGLGNLAQLGPTRHDDIG